MVLRYINMCNPFLWICRNLTIKHPMYLGSTQMVRGKRHDAWVDWVHYDESLEHIQISRCNFEEKRLKSLGHKGSMKHAPPHFFSPILPSDVIAVYWKFTETSSKFLLSLNSKYHMTSTSHANVLNTLLLYWDLAKHMRVLLPCCRRERHTDIRKEFLIHWG